MQNRDFHMMIKEYLVSEGYSETHNEIFQNQDSLEKIHKFCGNGNKADQQSSLKDDEDVGIKENNNLYQIELRKKIKHFIITNKV